jgi:hypothetical protein
MRAMPNLSLYGPHSNQKMSSYLSFVLLLYVEDPYVVAQVLRELFLFRGHEQENYLNFDRVGYMLSQSAVVIIGLSSPSHAQAES